jgi:hypothetical protein
MVTEITDAHKCIKVFYVINSVFLLHVSGPLVAILRERHSKGWIYRNITKVYEIMHIVKI